jgi:NO-binding membrane sensor protein with MHYT domain
MAQIHHFMYGWVTPVLAYAMSVLGSLLGLTCAVRVREAPTPGRRAWWLILAAWAIGGTGIWVMHFTAMIGFAVDNSQIRYDVPVTAASAAVAIVVVGIGLFIVGLGRPTALKIMIGGLITGLGVNAMHYMGMAAMRMDGTVHYDRTLVGASIAIAVVAATVALWLAVTVRGAVAIVASALVMGVAVNGMHFTGMAAMSVTPHATGELHGATAPTLLVPIVVGVIFVMIGLAYAVLAAPTAEDRAAAEYLRARRADRENAAAVGAARVNGSVPSVPSQRRPSTRLMRDYPGRF